jgi:hypothetical protein
MEARGPAAGLRLVETAPGVRARAGVDATLQQLRVALASECSLRLPQLMAVASWM